jgi:transcriptional pleiotropic regulator of transition state genes
MAQARRLRKDKGIYDMKSTGIVRKVDDLGRIVIPIELRRTLNIAERDSLEIYVEGPAIILKKYEPEIRDGKRRRYICPHCDTEVILAD